MKRQIIVYAVSVIAIAGILVASLFADKRNYGTVNSKSNTGRVVIIGDSIMCNDIDGDSIATLFAQNSGFAVEDYSIGGTCATSVNKDNQIDYYMDMLNFLNIASFIVTGNLTSIYDDAATIEMSSPTCVEKMKSISGINFDEVDYLIVNYGVNDALQGVTAKSEYLYDTNTFGGCMRKGIEEIHEKYPDLIIIVNGMNYYYFNTVRNGKNVRLDAINDGYLTAYNREMAEIASEYDNVFYFDIADKLVIDSQNVSDYLCDGVHYSSDAKYEFVDYLLDFMKKQNEK